ncbi:sodium:solute symporter family transporter [Galbibacter sp.]|uniref:sodium:solute symporter family transporter n=1 Tax=Galbibacter sp. TaxID=2918471 RepID=UPI003A9280DA
MSNNPQALFNCRSGFLAKYKLNLLWLLVSFFMLNGMAQELNVQQLASLPGIEKEGNSLGYAGMYGGKVGDLILAMGGANFPNALPWEGGTKVWSDHILILKDQTWTLSKNTLPSALGYGASVSLDNGILCIGGNNSDGVSAQVFLVQLDPNDLQIEIKQYPPLPIPLANLSAVRDGEFIYVVGGDDSKNSSSSLYRLHLKELSTWEKLDDMPGPARSYHAAAVQETGFSRKLYVFSGRSVGAIKPTPLLDTYVAYDLKSHAWDNPVTMVIKGEPKVLMAASASAVGSMSVLLYGGDTGEMFTRLEKLSLELEQTKDSARHIKLQKEKEHLLTSHQGFSNNVYAFNTVTARWSVYDTIEDLPVTALSFKDANSMYLVSGEIRPGVRTPATYKIQSRKDVEAFGLLNYTAMGIYLLVLVIIGLYFSKKQKSTEDYFRGGGRIPWWASGLSVFGTLLSALTFMAIPAKAFLTDWSYFFLNIAAILITPVIAIYFIPYFNRLKISTAYEFLEIRFNYTARALGSLSFMLFQIGRIGIILLLPSLAITIVTGIPVEASILFMGVLCVLYTTFGGIEAVIWTDVLQVVVLMGGSILAIFWIFFQGDVSVAQAYDLAVENQKFNIINWDFDFTSSTIWVVLLGGLASSLITQGTDQTIVQRYLTSSSVKDARKTLYTNAVMTLPATIIFFGIGTLLFVFYSQTPEKLPPQINNNDSIFPWYIVHELPAGVSGFLIAGLFSAAMSSISSSLNSISTAFCNDFYQKIYPKTSDLKLLRIARITTLVIGIAGILFAFWMANSNIKSLWDQFYVVLGLITGGLGGMFLLGILTKRANAYGALIGVLVSVLVTWYVSQYTNVNFLFLSVVGIVSCYVPGYLFSFIFPQGKDKKLIR